MPPVVAISSTRRENIPEFSPDGQHVVFEPRNMSPDELLHNTGRAWKKTYQYNSIARRVLGSGSRMTMSVAANLGYRFYANNLDKFYTCDWQLAARA